MEPVVVRFTSDQQSLGRDDVPDSPRQRTRMSTFYTTWRQQLREVPFDKLSQKKDASTMCCSTIS
jgi:hypothetical protein